jgi:hypothetical protein
MEDKHTTMVKDFGTMEDWKVETIGQIMNVQEIQAMEVGLITSMTIA